MKSKNRGRQSGGRQAVQRATDSRTSSPRKSGNLLWKFALIVLLAVGSGLLSLMLGAVQIPVGEVLSALGGGGEPQYANIVRNVRLPRTIAVAQAAVCLSVAGLLLQNVLKNPMASPSLLGVTSGAGLMAIVTFLLFSTGTGGLRLLPLSTFAGAMGAAVFIYLLAYRQGEGQGRLILAGVAVSSMLNAAASLLTNLFPDRLVGMTGFLSGSFSGVTFRQVQALAPYALLAVGAALLFPPYLNVLVLGEDTARSLGMRVELVRLLALAVSALLSAGAVSAVGMLGFVGLIVPHIGRLLFGNNLRILYPATAVLSVTLVTACDLIARLVILPAELATGVVLAVAGGPFFLWLLRSRSREGVD